MDLRELRNRILGPYRISHHPLCDNFNDHVYKIWGRKVCRGCTMQYSGMILAFILIVLGGLPNINFWLNWTDLEFGILLYILIAPTLITAFFIDNRFLKDGARFLLGMAFSFSFVLFIFTSDWLVKGFILLNFIPGYFYLQKRREMKNEDVCKGCDEFQNSPFCSGYQIYQDRKSIFLSQAYHDGIQDSFALSPESLEENQ